MVGALATTLSLAAAPTAASATVSAAARESFNVGHLNILSTLSHADFVDDLNRVTSRAGLVALNEVQNRTDFLRSWADNNGWHLYAPSPNAASAEALLAKKSMFDVLNRGSKFACDTNVGEPPPPRYTNWVKYRHKATGRSIFHINAHANSHIDNGGHPYNLPRTKCAEKQFRDIRDLAADMKGRGQVIVSGDLNVDYVADRRVQYANFPFVVLEDRGRTANLPGLRSSYTTHGVEGDGTLGNRHIDYIYHWKRLPEYRKMWMMGYYILYYTKSDHRGVVANFEIAT